MMKHLGTSLSLALLATTGCGMVKIAGLPGGSSTTQPSSASAASAKATPTPKAGAAGGQAATPDGAKDDLVKLYLAVNWKDYEDRYRSAGAAGSIHLTGVDNHGKPLYAVTPDAAWLPGWNPGRDSSVDLPFQLAQAGINRTWQKQCFEDHAAFRAAWQQIEATYRPKLDEAKQLTNFYAKTDALRELFAAVTADAAKHEVELSHEHPGRYAGLRWEILSELLHTVADTKHSYALKRVLGPIGEVLPAYLQHGRAWTTDEAFERDAFCLAAMDFGTHKTRKLPQPGQTGFEFGGVAFPVSDARAKEITAKLKTVTAERPPAAEGATVRLDSAERDKGTVLAFGLEVKAVKRDGDKAVLQLYSQHDNAVGYDCRQTSKVDSYTDGGQPLYHKDCKTGTESKIEAIDATFDDLPAAFKVAKGDHVEIYGAVSSVKDGSKITGGGALQVFRRDVVMHGGFLVVVPGK